MILMDYKDRVLERAFNNKQKPKIDIACIIKAVTYL